MGNTAALPVLHSHDEKAQSLRRRQIHMTQGVSIPWINDKN